MAINKTARLNNSIRAFLKDADQLNRFYEMATTPEQKSGFLRELENQARTNADRVGLNVFEFGEAVEAYQMAQEKKTA
jgi:hypothetical protein